MWLDEYQPDASLIEIGCVSGSFSPPEPLAATWSPNLAASAASVMPEGGRVILDGLAWFDWILDDSGQPAGARFAAPVEADGQWVWQILTWTADGIEVRQQAMN